jgi:hypothetical protein
MKSNKGYLEKSSRVPNSAFRMEIVSSSYQVYASGKISLPALILNQNPNFSGSLIMAFIQANRQDGCFRMIFTIDSVNLWTTVRAVL